MEPGGAEPVVRNLRFALSAADVPRQWHARGRSVTTFFDALSTFFPVGERFFMASVRAHLHHVRDPALLRDARAFAAQEGIHGREHARYNAMLEQHGYPVRSMERRVSALLGAVSRVTTPRMQLAATCALEHFTGLMGHMLLGDPGVLHGAHPVMAALWRWHSAEENEHKAVAYDVYLAARGTYAERVLVMVAASVIFWAKVLEHQARMMAVDARTLFSLSEWRTLLRFLAVNPGALRGVARLYFAYYRPRFHPRDIDCSALVEAWAADAESTRGYADAAA